MSDQHLKAMLGAIGSIEASALESLTSFEASRMTHELRNTHEAKDDEPKTTAGADLVWPREGEFMPRRPLADATEPHIQAIRQLHKWCGDFRAAARFRNALDQLEIARDLLRTERHR